MKEDETLTLTYADDVAVVPKTVTQFQEVLSKWNKEIKERRYEDQ